MRKLEYHSHTAGIAQWLVQRPSKPWIRVRSPLPAPKFTGRPLAPSWKFVVAYGWSAAVGLLDLAVRIELAIDRTGKDSTLCVP